MSIYRLPNHLITNVVYATCEKHSLKKTINIPTIYQDDESMTFDFENLALTRMHTLLNVVSVLYSDVDIPIKRKFTGSVGHLFTLERL